MKCATHLAKHIFLTIVLLFSSLLFGQGNKVSLSLRAVDSAKILITDATIIAVDSKNQSYIQLTNDKGEVIFSLTPDNYTIHVNHIGFQHEEFSVSLLGDLSREIVLTPNANILEEMIITATESKGLTSTSVINRQAMEHLQPSSFTDLMELLPGGQAKDPILTSVNPVLLRENGSSGYNTSSLGVQFMMDGNVLNSNADLQVSSNTTSGPLGKTSHIGIDMRSIATNDIESVEVIRGIPTAAYGDLTSGLIKINRKVGYTPLQARFKVDGFSKLYYVGKGIDTKSGWRLNASVDFLDAKSEPRNVLENYKRVSASLRSEKAWTLNDTELVWKSNLDYSGTIDNDKFDPDTGFDRTDSYKNSKQYFSLGNNLQLNFPEYAVFNNVKLNTYISQGIEDIKGSVFVQQSGRNAIPISNETGVNEGVFLPSSYVSNYKTQGRPLNINTTLQTTLGFVTGGISHEIESGIEFRYSKNNGDGEVYDPMLPPTLGVVKRPRPFKDIPASQLLAAYIGDRMEYDLGAHHLQLYGGLRMSKMLGISKDFSISDRVFVEPRVNFQWGLPEVKIGNDFLKTDITVGYGELYKQPTLALLYPQDRYFDMAQVSYYDPQNDNYYAQFYTYRMSLQNQSLIGAKNIKREIRLDLAYNKHKFYITYFDEKMSTGFRDMTQFMGFEYDRYEAKDIVWNDELGRPNLDSSTSTNKQVMSQYSHTENGSNTFKTGIEFGYSSPRFESINTRFTLNGAWFKTTYSNSAPILHRPGLSVNGQEFLYAGIYADDNGYRRSSLVYNLVVDTYLPSLDMNISASLQGDLFRRDLNLNRVAAPYAYIGIDNVVHEYTEESMKDPMLQHLVRNVSSTDGMEKRTPFTFNANFKISKRIYKSVKASMFVNRLFTHYESYTFNGVKVNRKDDSGPYFGMEINFNI
ncbi:MULTISPECIES: TonB-dependent receptor plug domain-containing protein [Myroides]|uniref:TonB-dependent receptor plug domain-containing protein n=1 Tax=Myroides albus TaxID=2562892 RepID=A0A6I3LGM5_9FLAO|nr:MULTISPECIES: TonB-dependent receptor plug domain-containing protein [Myroides]MTG97017.1 TonB-dependent receptor plug domain-containing protein [Myroides albus]MVX35811.1 TonB-dependent receptor plug domain-containing protein [Myroides sp. LoEW2-1]UVD78558.1 TonB-dependent receptor plug domain-containing protein [Myroides albus]